jgi:hypothetical protein
MVYEIVVGKQASGNRRGRFIGPYGWLIAYKQFIHPVLDERK